jgi:hypothetical protein
VLTENILRFLLGGTLVAAFALIGELLKPKSFAGLFAAAPSVALATLFLTIRYQGIDSAALEARAMIGGAAALLIYAVCFAVVTTRYELPALPTSLLLLTIWFGAAMSLRLFLFS